MIPERRVRTLRLVAPEESWIGRGAFLVEDALRTASLPWADAGRLLLIRTVDLGTIPAGAAPSSVALALESKLRELASGAVHAARPGAPGAAAVWFRDAAEAHALLAAKLAWSEDATAWFWPLAVPAWKPGTPRSAALRAVLLGALDTPAGPAAALEVVRALQEAGGLDFLCSALTPADGPPLLRSFGWRAPEEKDHVLPGGRGTGALVLARQAEGWGRSDARTVWLGLALRAVEPSPPGPLSRPPAPLSGRGGKPSPPAGLISLLGPRAGEGRTAKASLEEETRRSFPPLPVEGGAMGEGGQGGEVHRAPEPKASPSTHFPSPSPAGLPSPARGPIREIKPAGGEGSREPETVQQDLAPPALEPAAAFSPHAGLFFLLPVLVHLGLGAFLDDHPHLREAAFPARLLDHIAGRLGAGEDDPVRRALFLSGDVEIEGEAAFLKRWRIDVRRWCRRRAGIGLANLIRRSGHVAATRTHVDVFFDPRFVDIRVRRAGLDLDPGWVPWLGRVVLFHYAQPPEVLDAC